MASIEIRPDGPLAVTGPFELVDAGGNPVVHAELTVKLCRCGGSQNKPFCDGTHKRNGFTGARESDGAKDKVKDFASPGITIHDNRSVCMHAAECVNGLDAVFKSGARPWIDPAGATPEAIAGTVRKCPSGALSYTLAGREGEPESWPAAITIRKDGPYEVLGVDLSATQFAQGVPRNRYALCRCGASKNKPFCDGSHADVGFKA